MKIKKLIQKGLAQEGLNFWLTNRLPRRTLTRFMGWFSQIEVGWVRDASISVWKFFSDLDLSEARKTEFKSMHDCFVRELKEGARQIDERDEVVCSPCDAIVGAHGLMAPTDAGAQVFQAKGMAYTLEELLGDRADLAQWAGGSYVTLRLTSSMYHRFHAPHHCLVDEVQYFSGDVWNVNPSALKRVPRLFCKNERAVLRTCLQGGPASGRYIALVPVGAILVASIRLHFLDVQLHLKYAGPKVLPCQAVFAKGQEMGWFQHGSTILMFMPAGFALCEGLALGSRMRMGQALMRWVGAQPGR